MTEAELNAFYNKIQTGAKAAVAQALERHRKLGESVAVWQEDKVVVLRAEEISQSQKDNQAEGGNHD